VFPRADRSIAVEWVGYQVITLHAIEGLEKRANSVGTCRELAQAGPPLPPPHWWPENGPPPTPPGIQKVPSPEAAGHELGDVRSAAAVIKVVAIPW
jgi:hypothetical protein